MSKLILTEDEWDSITKFELEDIVDQGRWDTTFRYVFQWIDGKYYETYIYWCQPGYWDDNKTLECEEVYKTQKLQDVWVPVVDSKEKVE